MNVPVRRLTERDICARSIENRDGTRCALGWGAAFFTPAFNGQPVATTDDYMTFLYRLINVIGTDDVGAIMDWNNENVDAGKAHVVAAAINRTLDLLQLEEDEKAGRLSSLPIPAPALSARPLAGETR